MALAPPTSVRGELTSGPERKKAGQHPVTNTIPMNAAPTSLSISATSLAVSPTWRLMCAVSRPKNFTGGWSIAIPRQEQPHWRIHEPRPAIAIPSAFDSGASETSPGAVEEILLPKSTRQNFAASPPGFQVTEWTCRLSHPVPMWTIGAGLAVFLKRLSGKDPANCGE